MNLMTDKAIDDLLATIYERYHYDFRGYARGSMERRIENAISRLGARDVGELRELIDRDATAFAKVIQWFTIQLSELFRDPDYFRHFREQIVPVLRTYPSRKLWVAGCSTGEEAYSFAIVLAEEGLLDRTLIYATDIYAPSLSVAETGIYALDRMRSFSENHRKSGATRALSEHYTAGERGALFSRELREHIVFADHSLATDSVFAEVQVVSCRNVLIYFADELQDRAFGLFSNALVRNGWLGLAPKETLQFSSHARHFAPLPERWFQKRVVP